MFWNVSLRNENVYLFVCSFISLLIYLFVCLLTDSLRPEI